MKPKWCCCCVFSVPVAWVTEIYIDNFNLIFVKTNGIFLFVDKNCIIFNFWHFIVCAIEWQRQSTELCAVCVLLLWGNEQSFKKKSRSDFTPKSKSTIQGKWMCISISVKFSQSRVSISSECKRKRQSESEKCNCILPEAVEPIVVLSFHHISCVQWEKIKLFSLVIFRSSRRRRCRRCLLFVDTQNVFD